MSYKAFISYSHTADGQLAPALQSALQKFAKPFYRLRAMRIFRDETSLHLTPKLWPMVQQSLAASEHFILMASPKAARSEWVRKEIDEWLELRDGSLDNFHLVLTEGEIFWDNKAGDFDWDFLRVMETSSQKVLGEFKARVRYKNPSIGTLTESFTGVVFSPDDKGLAVSSWTGPDYPEVRLWDFASKREPVYLKSKLKQVTRLAFSPDGGVLFTGGEDGRVRLWHTAAVAAK